MIKCSRDLKRNLGAWPLTPMQLDLFDQKRNVQALLLFKIKDAILLKLT